MQRTDFLDSVREKVVDTMIDSGSASMVKSSLSSEHKIDDQIKDLIQEYDRLETRFWKDEIGDFKGVISAYLICFQGAIKDLNIPFHYSETGGVAGLFTTKSMQIGTRISERLEQETKIALNTRKFSHKIKEKIDEYLSKKHGHVKCKVAELLLKIAEQIDAAEPWVSNPVLKKNFLSTRYLKFLKAIKKDKKIINFTIFNTTFNSYSNTATLNLINSIEKITRYQIAHILYDNKDIGRWLDNCYDNLSNITNQSYSLVHGYCQLKPVPQDLRTCFEILSDRCQDLYFKKDIEISTPRREEIHRKLKEIKKSIPDKIRFADRQFLADFSQFDEKTDSYTPDQFLRELLIRPATFVKKFPYTDIVSDEVLDLYCNRDDPDKQEQLLLLFKRHVFNLDYFYNIAQKSDGKLLPEIIEGIRIASSGRWDCPERLIEIISLPSKKIEIPAIIITSDIFPFINVVDSIEKKENKGKLRTRQSKQQQLFNFLQEFDNTLTILYQSLILFGI